MTEPVQPVPPDKALGPPVIQGARPSRMNRMASSPTVITFIWITSAILNVVFLASIVLLGLLYNHNSTALHNSSVSQCQANNTNRKEDVAIWNQFLGDLAPPGSPQTAKVHAELTQIYALIRVKDTPRNCVKAYQP